MKTLTQESMRLEIAEYLKDCETDEFMKVVEICFGDYHPKLTDSKDDRGFHKIEIEW